MGNLSFLIPTKNLQDFTQNNIFDILTKEFPEFKITSDNKWKQITVRTKKDVLVTDIFFNAECYILDYDKDIETLKNDKNYRNTELILKLNVLRSFNPDLQNCISLTYGSGIFMEDKFRVEKVLMKYFNGYLFDEGIHPEFQTFEEL